MKRARGVILLGLLIVCVVGLCLWFADRAAKVPMVRGEPLDYWLTAGRYPSAEFQAAVAEMDENCVPYLIAQLKWSPPTAKIAINRILKPIFRRALFSEDIDPDCRDIAATVLGKLGAKAQTAIEPLRYRATHGSLTDNHDLFARSAAVAALVLLGADTLDGCVDKIIDANNTNWSVYAYSILYLTTNAAPAVPRLVKAFESSDNKEYKGRFAIPLRFVRCEPELVVPIFKVLLGYKSELVKFDALVGLQNLGANSKPAWAELTALLTDQSDSIRQMTTNALKRIDPVAAKSLGIE
jgi:HEAT repeat protein